VLIQISLTDFPSVPSFNTGLSTRFYVIPLASKESTITKTLQGKISCDLEAMTKKLPLSLLRFGYYFPTTYSFLDWLEKHHMPVHPCRACRAATSKRCCPPLVLCLTLNCITSAILPETWNGAGQDRYAHINVRTQRSWSADGWMSTLCAHTLRIKLERVLRSTVDWEAVLGLVCFVVSYRAVGQAGCARLGMVNTHLLMYRMQIYACSRRFKVMTLSAHTH